MVNQKFKNIHLQDKNVFYFHILALTRSTTSGWKSKQSRNGSPNGCDFPSQVRLSNNVTKSMDGCYCQSLLSREVPIMWPLIDIFTIDAKMFFSIDAKMFYLFFGQYQCKKVFPFENMVLMDWDGNLSNIFLDW